MQDAAGWVHGEPWPGPSSIRGGGPGGDRRQTTRRATAGGPGWVCALEEGFARPQAYEWVEAPRRRGPGCSRWHWRAGALSREAPNPGSSDWGLGATRHTWQP